MADEERDHPRKGDGKTNNHDDTDPKVQKTNDQNKKQQKSPQAPPEQAQQQQHQQSKTTGKTSVDKEGYTTVAPRKQPSSVAPKAAATALDSRPSAASVNDELERRGVLAKPSSESREGERKLKGLARETRKMEEKLDKVDPARSQPAKDASTPQSVQSQETGGVPVTTPSASHQKSNGTSTANATPAPWNWSDDPEFQRTDQIDPFVSGAGELDPSAIAILERVRPQLNNALIAMRKSIGANELADKVFDEFRQKIFSENKKNVERMFSENKKMVEDWTKLQGKFFMDALDSAKKAIEDRDELLKKTKKALEESQKREKTATEALTEATKLLESFKSERDALQADLNVVSAGKVKLVELVEVVRGHHDTFDQFVPLLNKLSAETWDEQKARLEGNAYSRDNPAANQPTGPASSSALVVVPEDTAQPQPPAANARTDDSASPAMAGIHLDANARGNRGGGRGQRGRGRGRGGGRGGRGGGYVEDGRCDRCIKETNDGDSSYASCDLASRQSFPCNHCKTDGEWCQSNATMATGRGGGYASGRGGARY